ncbi:hypothetical protein [Dehalogenimonas formicexedens]|uniref:hypothetical protein n=1 Tax=Dehalogenimonas formicexedens TaxID=1839801 RepID=UPI0011AB7482|nr:hypothetical protein [Dehalogenimonas formicexedens]
MAAAWVAALALNGYQSISSSSGLLNLILDILFQGTISAGVFGLIVYTGFKKPVISGIVLALFMIVGIGYFVSPRSHEVNIFEDLVVAFFIAAQGIAMVLYFISAKPGKRAFEPRNDSRSLS